jgi:hypothetical protein
MNDSRRSMTVIAYWRFSCRSPHRVPANLKAESELVQGTPFTKPACVRFRGVLPSNHLTDEVIV